MTTTATDLVACVTTTAATVEVVLVDPRSDALAVFGELTPELGSQLAADAWVIGLRALGNARAEARECRLAEIGERLVTDVDAKLEQQFAAHEQAMAAGLARFFDPSDGSVTQRLAEFVADEGALARALDKHIGPHRSVLTETLGRLVGDASPLLRRLSPDGDDSVVKAIEDRLANAVAGSQRELARALDPACDDSPVRRFLVTLRDDLAKADKDRHVQLATALAALDANDETSLISRLFRETQQARTSLLAAINPDAPDSPMAAIRTGIEAGLARHAARQEQVATELREAIARLETRRAQQSRAPSGGLAFEDAVAELVQQAVAEGPYVTEATGASIGAVARCKKGDVVVRFTAESAFDGAAVVFEAKRDAAYTVRTALEELDAARKNRAADVGVFVMAASHAPTGFPRFARHGHNVLVQWDESDPATDVFLRCAVYLGMGLVSRTRAAGDPGDTAAISDLAGRLEAEITRIERMEKLNEGARRANDGLADELRKSRRAVERMVADTQAVLRALHLDVVDETTEANTPIAFRDAPRDGATHSLPTAPPAPVHG